MSNLSPTGGRGGRIPAPPPGRPIASYRDYLEAQRAVDFLSDEKFPVQHVSIVGTDLKMVERVTGRLTYGRVAVAGVFSGAYFGGFVGLLLGLFGGQGQQLGATLLFGVLIGAGFGMIFGVISFAATGGRRDFTSTSQIVAGEYAVWCADEHAVEATRVLSGLGGSGVVRAMPAQPVETVKTLGDAHPDTGAEPGGPTYSEMIARQKAQRQQDAAAEEASREQQERPRGRRTRPDGSRARVQRLGFDAGHGEGTADAVTHSELHCRGCRRLDRDEALERLSTGPPRLLRLRNRCGRVDLAGREHEHDVAVRERVDGVDRTSEAVVTHVGHPRRGRHVESRVGGHHDEGGVERWRVHLP